MGEMDMKRLWHMGEENIKKDMWTCGTARNMENKQ
jgi:hypothetical protein